MANASNPMALISEYLASGQFSNHASSATVQKGDNEDNKSYNPFDEEEDWPKINIFQLLIFVIIF